MAVTKTLITTLASEFLAIEEARILALAEILEDQVPVAVWGSRTDLALAYLICHELKLDAQRGNGPVTEEKLGDVSRKYAVLSEGKSSEYNLTTYGQRYLALRRKSITSARVT